MNQGQLRLKMVAFRWPLLWTAALLLSGQLQFSIHGQLLTQGTNALHVILYGFLAVLLVRAFQKLNTGSDDLPFRSLLYSALLAGLIAAVLELAQIPISRDANLADWLRSCAGILGFIGLFAGIAPAFRVRFQRLPIVRFGVLLISAAVIVSVVAPFFGWVFAYSERARSFPVIVDFDRAWSTYFVRANNSDFDRVRAPHGIGNDQWLGRVRIKKGKYSGIAMIEPYPDWREHEQLILAGYLDSPDEQSIMLRIEDRAHTNETPDRYQRELRLRPGRNQIEIPLRTVRNAPSQRIMNMGEIRRLVLYDVAPTEPYVVYLEYISLE